MITLLTFFYLSIASSLYSMEYCADKKSTTITIKCAYGCLVFSVSDTATVQKLKKGIFHASGIAIERQELYPMFNNDFSDLFYLLENNCAVNYNLADSKYVTSVINTYNTQTLFLYINNSGKISRDPNN